MWLWRLCAPATGWEILVLDAPVLALSWKGQKDSVWYSHVFYGLVLCCTDGQHLAKLSPGVCTSTEEVKEVVRWSCAKSWSFRFAGWPKQVKKKIKKLYEFRLTKDGNVLLFWAKEKSETTLFLVFHLLGFLVVNCLQILQENSVAIRKMELLRLEIISAISLRSFGEVVKNNKKNANTNSYFSMEIFD